MLTRRHFGIAGPSEARALTFRGTVLVPSPLEAEG